MIATREQKLFPVPLKAIPQLLNLLQSAINLESGFIPFECRQKRKLTLNTMHQMATIFHRGNSIHGQIFLSSQIELIFSIFSDLWLYAWKKWRRCRY